MPDALSVDAVCGFGAKIFTGCAGFIQPKLRGIVSASGFSGHFGVPILNPGAELVHGVKKCHMSGRPWKTRALSS